MKRQKIQKPNLDEWQRLPFEIKAYIVFRLFIAVDLPRILHRVDLWLFPPAIFFSAYLASNNNFPPHPIKMLAVLSTAFMAATLALFLLRPARRLQVHWVRS
jgi:hypothetical protein